jgi:hypothetical protein
MMMTFPKTRKDMIFPATPIVRLERSSTEERLAPCFFENRVYASQENSFGISRRFPMIGKDGGPGG